MPWIDTTNLTQAVSEIKAYCVGLFFPKAGGNVSGNVSASGEVSATETVGGSSVTHNLTDKLDEEDYLSGLTWGQIKAKYTWGDLKGNTSSDMHTTNLNLSKPARLSPTAMNGNMDILDEKIGAVGSTDLQTQVTSLSDSIDNPEYVADLNDFGGNTNATYMKRYSNTTTNRPDQWGAVVVIGHAQIAFGGDSGRIYTRRFSDNQWSAWKSVVLS